MLHNFLQKDSHWFSVGKIYCKMDFCDEETQIATTLIHCIGAWSFLAKLRSPSILLISSEYFRSSSMYFIAYFPSSWKRCCWNGLSLLLMAFSNDKFEELCLVKCVTGDRFTIWTQYFFISTIIFQSVDFPTTKHDIPKNGNLGV